MGGFFGGFVAGLTAGLGGAGLGAVTGAGAALGIVVGTAIATIAPFVSVAGTLFSAAFTKAPEKPKLAQRRSQIIVTGADPAKADEVVYGTVRKGGTYALRQTTNNQRDLHLAIVLADHECEAIDEVFFNEELAFDAGGTVQPKFAGKAFITKHLGSDTQLADTDLVADVEEWTANHRLRGRCYLRVKLIFDRDLFPSVPNISVVMRGKKIFDTRSSLTAFSSNPSLQLADYLNDGLHGLQAPYVTEIDSTALNAAANVNDEIVAIPNAGTEKRYTGNGVIDTADTPELIIKEMLTANAGSLIFSGGKWIIKAGAFEAATAPTFNENDLRGDLDVETNLPKREIFNAVRGTFVSPKNKWQPADFPPLESTLFQNQDNGEQIWSDIELPFTTSETMAERLAKIHLFSAREQIVAIFPTSLKALQLRAGDTVNITVSRMGWTDKPFLVNSWQFVVKEEGGVALLETILLLRETSSAVYDITASEQTLIGAAPDTELPSPLDPEIWSTTILPGNNSIVSSVVANFEAINEPKQEPAWLGTKTGLIKNPVTGHLNVDDQVLANGNDQNIFDDYVQTPVPNPSYETPEISIGFDDAVRAFAPSTVVAGPGETGSFKKEIKFDNRLDAGAFDGFEKLIRKEVTARHFKYRMEFDTTGGAGFIVKNFRPSVSKKVVIERRRNIAIPVGGRSFVFAQQYHNPPTVTGQVQATTATRVPIISGVSGTGFTVKIFDGNDVDVGGTLESWRSEGV